MVILHVEHDVRFETLTAAEAFRDRLRELWERAGPSLGLEGAQARVLEVVEADLA